MIFKVNKKFIYDKCEYVITSVVEENVHYHNNFEKSKELVYRISTDELNIGFIVFKKSDRIVLNKSSNIYLTKLEDEKIKSLKVLDYFIFNSHNFVLRKILDVDALDLGVGKSYVFVDKVNEKLKFSLNVTFYSGSSVVNSLLLEIRDLTSFDFTFLD
jgi:hypothetical protein